ncbi:MAG: hypothetical protein OXF27_12940 [Acidobacteria bacterium]|nr:hypothetical protein [Acidobacteriota bacterium]
MHSTRKQPPTHADGALTVRLRAPDPGHRDPNNGSEAHQEPHLGTLSDPWPDRPWREGYGWPVWIPPTSPRAYLSGSFALNLPTLPGKPRLGDWHDDGAWWSQVYVDGRGRPVDVPLWGPDGATTATPGTPRLHDARPALAQVHHPAAEGSTPVLAATIPQAIADMAWGSLHGLDQQPCRHDVFRWTDEAAEAELRALTAAIGQRIGEPALRERWGNWRHEALDGRDTFYDAPAIVTLATPEPVPVRIVADGGGDRRSV